MNACTCSDLCMFRGYVPALTKNKPFKICHMAKIWVLSDCSQFTHVMPEGGFAHVYIYLIGCR